MSVVFTLIDIREAMDDYSGFCIACGEPAYNVEPDAREYTCESCGAQRVYGAEEIAIAFPELIETDN